MLDTEFLRESPEVVRENIKKKLQDHKIELVDKVTTMDKKNRSLRQRRDELRNEKDAMSREISGLMTEGLKDETNTIRVRVQTMADEIRETEIKETELAKKIKEIVMRTPNIVHPMVPVGRGDSENVELQKYGESVVLDFEIPYHIGIMERFEDIDLDSVRKVAGNEFYYLMGDTARLHSAIISCARDFMINKGFTYAVSPFMIRSSVMTGVMGFAEVEGMMYKIEGEGLYLISTGEYSMIGKFVDTVLDEKKLPHTYASYSPCFRRERGTHGIEERGVHRVH